MDFIPKQIRRIFKRLYEKIYSLHMVRRKLPESVPEQGQRIRLFGRGFENMRPLIDRDITQTVTSLTGTILEKFFYYEDEDIEFFIQQFVGVINREHAHLQLNGNEEFKFMIWGNKDAKQKFTSTFLDFFLLETLAKALGFNEMELMHFENILLKYLKEVEPVEHAQNYERANDRNPFTPL